MSAEIIDFTTSHRTRIADDVPRPAPGTLTTTAKNARLRSARRKAWNRANALTGYWLALRHFALAVSVAKDYGLKEARAHPGISDQELDRYHEALGEYREALGKQLLTPAPDVAAVNWKRHNLRRDPYIGVKKELVEKAIADDIAFLDAHSVKKKKGSPVPAA
jgi:hypothetical protein